ncbi:hypothetical protein AZE42_03045 [Rhizopogon vesiculosus]|uniref:Uncharacterized protein n=1 Tax=Rhizopogon vesiculosus TaxID=180088 RepID=A0A1J8Q6J5_9AGAM|nr:hypothetical protein AZE42_03045 [Rhizopogon vesiculosus]
MFVTLFVLYRALAYILGHLWGLNSAVRLASPFSFTLGLVGRYAFIVTLKYHPRTEHLVVDVVMYICTLIIFFNVARSVLVGKKVPANHARSCPGCHHVSLEEMNDALEVARKAVEKLRQDLRSVEHTSLVTAEVVSELTKARKNTRAMCTALQEMVDMLDQHDDALRALPSIRVERDNTRQFSLDSLAAAVVLTSSEQVICKMPEF